MEVCLSAFFVAPTINLFEGWIVTFIVKVRHGGPSSGYISSGFFGGKRIIPLSILILLLNLTILYAGLTVGRILLLWVNKKVGERRVMFMYALLAIGYDLVHRPSFVLSHTPFPALNS